MGRERLGNEDGLGAKADRDVGAGDGDCIDGHHRDAAERLRVEEHEAPGDSVGDFHAGVAKELGDDGPALLGIEGVAGPGAHRRDDQLGAELALRGPFDEVVDVVA